MSIVRHVLLRDSLRIFFYNEFGPEAPFVPETVEDYRPYFIVTKNRETGELRRCIIHNPFGLLGWASASENPNAMHTVLEVIGILKAKLQCHGEGEILSLMEQKIRESGVDLPFSPPGVRIGETLCSAHD